MNLALKRWIRFTAFLVLVMILCWQNSSDSENLTNLVYGVVRTIEKFFGQDATYSIDNYYITRKVGHCIVFAIMAFFSHVAIAATANNHRSAMVCSFIVNPVIAIVTEICQTYALSRTTSIIDALINICGCIIGIGIATLYVAVNDEKTQDKGNHEK